MPVDFLLAPQRVHATKPGCNYNLPPLDGSLTVPEIYDWHLEHNPDFPLFRYVDADGKLIHVPYSQAVPAAHRAARFVAKAINIDPENVPPTCPIVAVVASSDTITTFCTILGMMRAGIPCAAISPRNSAPAIAHLLSKTASTHVLISVEPALRELLDATIAALQENNAGLEPLVSYMPTFADIFLDPAVPFTPLSARKYDLEAPLAYLHTSGSSSFPKPIKWTHTSLLQVALTPHFGAHDLCGVVFGCHAVAMSHAIGLNHLAWVSGTGIVMATFAPASPATIPTPDAVFGGIVASGAQLAICVPSFAELWSRDPEKVAFLAGIYGLVYGGGPLNKDVGDYLAAEGVSIYTMYGTTEVGVIGSLFPAKLGADWEYFTLNPHCAAELVPAGDGLFELVIIRRPTQVLTIVNTTLRGEDAYATNDLLRPHPTRPGHWAVVGRSDDQIMLSTGEKTNPGPLEAILMRHPRVKTVIMFGRGRFQNGVLIEPAPASAFDPADEARLVEFRNDLWPTIEEMNAFAPTHSRLFKEMVLVASPAKPFLFTAKNTTRRALTLELYAAEIDAAYALVEDSAQADLPPPDDWSPASALRFVRSAVASVVPHVADDDDIFERGCDSLQATWIRNTLLHALRSTGGAAAAAARAAPAGFVYAHPTPAALARFVAALAAPDPAARADDPAAEAARRAAGMQALLARFGAGFKQHAPAARAADGAGAGAVVLVTGTTGALGAHVLARLAADGAVARVFALNRRARTGAGLVERQQRALAERGLDAGAATAPKVVLLEGDLGAAGLGVGAAREEEIRSTITHIIHIAWRVDFNLSLASFESAVAGVRTLVNLALSSPLQHPPRLLFTSSIGVFRNLHDAAHAVAEQPLEDPAVAVGQGYSESKWVAERILNLAAQHAALRTVVVRLGQLSGGPDGAWNTSDWVPALVKSSTALGCLPDVPGVVSWLPVHVAAAALLEMRDADAGTLHVVHPAPVPFRALLGAAAAALAQPQPLPLRPYGAWLALLEDARAQVAGGTLEAARVPALKILDFFRGVRVVGDGDGGAEVEAMGLPSLALDRALEVAPALRGAVPLGEADVRRWLAYWGRVGFL